MQSLTLNAVLRWVCEEGIALDMEKAQEIIDSYIGKDLMTAGEVSQTEFNKLFQKGMFKNSLIKIANTFEKQVQDGLISADLSLRCKLDYFQRNGMLKGLDRNSDTHKDTKKMLASLKDILESANPDYAVQARLHFLEAISDPAA